MYAYGAHPGDLGTWSSAQATTPPPRRREIYYDPKAFSPFNNQPGRYVAPAGDRRYRSTTWPAGRPTRRAPRPSAAEPVIAPSRSDGCSHNQLGRGISSALPLGLLLLVGGGGLHRCGRLAWAVSSLGSRNLRVCLDVLYGDLILFRTDHARSLSRFMPDRMATRGWPSQAFGGGRPGSPSAGLHPSRLTGYQDALAGVVADERVHPRPTSTGHKHEVPSSPRTTVIW